MIEINTGIQWQSAVEADRPAVADRFVVEEAALLEEGLVVPSGRGLAAEVRRPGALGKMVAELAVPELRCGVGAGC